MTSKILSLVPLAHSVQLAGHSYEIAKKKDKKVGDFVKGGVGTIIGAEFIKAESDIIGSM